MSFVSKFLQKTTGTLKNLSILNFPWGILHYVSNWLNHGCFLYFVTVPKSGEDGEPDDRFQKVEDFAIFSNGFLLVAFPCKTSLSKMATIVFLPIFFLSFFVHLVLRVDMFLDKSKPKPKI